MTSSEMNIRKLMTKSVVTVKEDSSINKIETIFSHSGLSHLLVVNENDKLTGIISKNDFLSFYKFLTKETSGKTWTQKQLSFYTAKLIMSTCLCTLDVKDTIESAMELFINVHYHCIPILDGEALVGILTPYDIVNFVYKNQKSNFLKV